MIYIHILMTSGASRHAAVRQLSRFVCLQWHLGNQASAASEITSTHLNILLFSHLYENLQASSATRDYISRSESRDKAWNVTMEARVFVFWILDVYLGNSAWLPWNLLFVMWCLMDVGYFLGPHT